MKKRMLACFLALATLCGGAWAKNKALDRPAVKSTGTHDLLPVKGELTKTARIGHFRMVWAHWGDWSTDGARLEGSG